MAKQKRYRVREGFINGTDNMIRWYGSMETPEVRKLQKRGLTRGDIIYWWEFDMDDKTPEEIDAIIAEYFEEVEPVNRQ